MVLASAEQAPSKRRDYIPKGIVDLPPSESFPDVIYIYGNIIHNIGISILDFRIYTKPGSLKFRIWEISFRIKVLFTGFGRFANAGKDGNHGIASQCAVPVTCVEPT